MRTRVVVTMAALTVAATACSSTSSKSSPPSATTNATTTTVGVKPAQPIVFNGQGNDFAAYTSTPPFKKQIVIHHNDATHPKGLDVNGQICFDPQHPGRFVAGEDTFQTTTGHPGWGIFQLSGNEVGKPFPWVVSDFSLLEAIEAGLVKIKGIFWEHNIKGYAPFLSAQQSFSASGLKEEAIDPLMPSLRRESSTDLSIHCGVRPLRPSPMSMPTLVNTSTLSRLPRAFIQLPMIVSDLPLP